MVHRLSESAIKEIQGYYSRNYASRSEMFWDVGRETEQMLKDCGFVYITERGHVIHAISLCGTGYQKMVPLDIALKYGYNRLCKTCTCGTYVAWLFHEKQENALR